MKKLNLLILFASIVTLFSSCGQATKNDSALGEKSVLPWNLEIYLKEAAKSVNLVGILNTNLGRSTMSINNLKMHTVIWRNSDKVTVRLTNNNVWNHRLHEFKSPTLQEINEEAFSQTNKYYMGLKEIEFYLINKVDFNNYRTLAGKTHSTKQEEWLTIASHGKNLPEKVIL